MWSSNSFCPLYRRDQRTASGTSFVTLNQALAVVGVRSLEGPAHEGGILWTTRLTAGWAVQHLGRRRLRAVVQIAQHDASRPPVRVVVAVRPPTASAARRSSAKKAV